MPKCQTCTKYFPSKLTIIVNEALEHHQCVFCKAGKDYVTIIDEKTGKEEKLTKQYVIDEYQKFIKDVYNSRKVQDLIKPSRIIKPY